MDTADRREGQDQIEESESRLRGEVPWEGLFRVLQIDPWVDSKNRATWYRSSDKGYRSLFGSTLPSYIFDELTGGIILAPDHSNQKRMIYRNKDLAIEDLVRVLLCLADRPE